MNLYEGPIERGMIFTAPDNDGVLGHRRVRVLGEDMGGMFILEEMPSRMKRLEVGLLRRCPERNLRFVFIPEEEESLEEVLDAIAGEPDGV